MTDTTPDPWAMPDNYMGTFTAHRYTDRAALATWLGEEYEGQLLELSPRDQPDPDSGEPPTLVFSLANARHLGRLGHSDDSVIVRGGAWIVAYDAAEHGGGIAWMVSSRPFEWESALQRPPLDTRQLWSDVPEDVRAQLVAFGAVAATTLDELVVELGMIEDTAASRAAAAADMRRRLLQRSSDPADLEGDRWFVINSAGDEISGPSTFEIGLRYIGGFTGVPWEDLTWVSSGGDLSVLRPDTTPIGLALRWVPESQPD